MKTIKTYDELRIPDYSLPYLINGDDSGLEGDDKKNIDSYMAQFYKEAEENNAHVIFSTMEEKTTNEEGEEITTESESYFSNRPEFGLPCNVIDCIILIVK